MNNPSPEIIVALIAAAAGIITALGVLIQKISLVFIEVAKVKQKLNKEMAPNSGSTLKDSLNRVEAMQRGMQRDIGRLADNDLELRSSKSSDHDAIHKRLDMLAHELQSERERNAISKD